MYDDRQTCQRCKTQCENGSIISSCPKKGQEMEESKQLGITFHLTHVALIDTAVH